jgi:hypothetical protein
MTLIRKNRVIGKRQNLRKEEAEEIGRRQKLTADEHG